MLTVLLSEGARAFCGTYVGTPGEPVTNRESVVVVAFEGDTTVLTMANDFEGDRSEFGMLVPVPRGFDVADAAVVDPDVLARLDSYSAPRVVSYTCDDVAAGRVQPSGVTPSSSSGCGGGSAWPDASGDTGDRPVMVQAGLSAERFEEVVVHSHAVVGEYDLRVLSADEGALAGWLAAEGFVLDADAEPVVEQYLAEGVWFLAARVTAGTEAAWLSPLQLRMEGYQPSVPLRLGATSSAGTQDLVLYTLSDAAQGLATITNYPPAEVEDDCMPASEEGDWYGALLAQGLATDGLATWTTEFGWGSGGCDPCPDDEYLDDATVVALGRSGGAATTYVSRLRVRYGADEVPEDLLLHFAGDGRSTQVKYVTYAEELEALFPICGVGWAEAPGFCRISAAAPPPAPSGSGCPCASLPSVAGAWTVLALVAARRRRS